MDSHQQVLYYKSEGQSLLRAYFQVINLQYWINSTANYSPWGWGIHYALSIQAACFMTSVRLRRDGTLCDLEQSQELLSPVTNPSNIH